MFKTKFGLAAILTFVVCTTVFAQETGGVSSSESAGTVIKGKAPVAKELLKVRFPKPATFKLSNGLAVYVLEDHRAPVVRFRLEMRAGSIFETKPGIASLTAAMLTEGTTTRTDTQIAEDTESIGANLGASASLEGATLSAAGLSESTDQLIALTADVLLHPTFPTARLDRAKFSQRSSSSQRTTNPTAVIGELTSEVFYGGTKYARHPASRQDIDAITADDLKSFYTTHYVPDGALLGVTGDVNVNALHAKLEKALGDWKSSGSVANLPSADFQPKVDAHIFLVDRPGSAQSVLQFGTLAVKQTDPDFIALVVANRILGGGSSGRLFQNIRERKGYTYGAYSTFAAQKYPAVWGANASVRTEVTEPAIGEFFKEFARLQSEPVPATELSDAKRSIIGGFALTLQTPEGILGRSLEQVQNDLPANYWDTYAQRINAVTADDVQRVAKKFMAGKQVELFVVGERKKIEGGLSKYGSVEVVDPQKISGIGTKK